MRQKHDTIIVSAVSTHIGPETTVRIAVVRDYQVVFVRDCTANKDIPIPADVAKKVWFPVWPRLFAVIESSELIIEVGR